MDLAYLRSHWTGVHRGLVETVGKFREDELNFKPFPTSWSAREIMVHIAHRESGEFGYGINQVLPELPAQYNLQAYETRGAIVELLESVHAQTVAYLDQLADADLNRVIETAWGDRNRLIEMLGHLIEHEIHHRGELSLILGILGRQGLDA